MSSSLFNVVEAATGVVIGGSLWILRRDISALTEAITFSNDTLLDSATIAIGTNLVESILSDIETLLAVETGWL